ncbi:MAG: hypothetical protein JWO18_2977, partial [Microbacteriaceae bacterium]|nr:hypothetical protein [Microbacteriaceae bacterium]
VGRGILAQFALVAARADHRPGCVEHDSRDRNVAVFVGMRRSKRADSSVRPCFLAAGVLAVADVVVATVWS